MSTGVGIGGGLDITAPDVLEFLAEDPDTAAVALHIETVPDGPRLLEAVEHLASRKPVAALVVGKSDIEEFAQSHTGSLATSWATTRALLEQVGAVLVNDERELVNAASALTVQRRDYSSGRGPALVTGQAGPGMLIADELGNRGVELPPLSGQTRERLGSLLPPMTFLGNPVDTGRPGPEYPEILRAVGADPQVSAVGVYGITEPVVSLPAALEQSGLLGQKPVVIAVDGPQEDMNRVREETGSAVPVLQGPGALAQGLAALDSDVHRQAFRNAREAEQLPSAVSLSGTGPWHEAAAKTFLDSIGLRTPARVVCTDEAEARAALTTLRPPVAIKLLDAAVIHKTELGGVQLGIRTPEEMDSALQNLRRAGAREFLVEEMAPSGTDLLLGLRRDPVFGPILVFGLGGLEAEVKEDVAICALPASPQWVEQMPERLQHRQLLSGFRGRPRLEPQELVRAVTALSSAFLESPLIIDIEINPLRVTSEGLVALDAVITTREEDR
ncbi:hypothetical protein GCM10011359_29410 [Nesterenkonia alkaliphila]|nr:hypothetical protein GCM10011359_29410 [Nesterenkonia alkaliphila]